MDFDIQKNNVQFSWKGYSSGLPQMVERTMRNIIEMKNEESSQLEHLFNGAKTYIHRQWIEKDAGALETDSLSNSNDSFPSILYRVTTGDNSMVTSLGGYTFEQFKEHMNFWLISGTSEWLIHGNFTKIQAKTLTQNVRNSLKMKVPKIK